MMYERVAAAFYGTPWAMERTKFNVIRNVLAQAGGRRVLRAGNQGRDGQAPRSGLCHGGAWGDRCVDRFRRDRAANE